MSLTQEVFVQEDPSTALECQRTQRHLKIVKWLGRVRVTDHWCCCWCWDCWSPSERIWFLFKLLISLTFNKAINHGEVALNTAFTLTPDACKWEASNYKDERGIKKCMILGYRGALLRLRSDRSIERHSCHRFSTGADSCQTLVVILQRSYSTCGVAELLITTRLWLWIREDWMNSFSHSISDSQVLWSLVMRGSLVSTQLSCQL